MKTPRRLALSRRMGIRARVALFSTALSALLFLLVAAGFYLYLSRALHATFDTSLSLRAQQIASGVSYDNGVVTIQDVTGELPDNATTTPAATPSAADSTSGADAGPNATGASGPQSDVSYATLVRVLDASGATVYVSPGFRTLSVPAASVRAALASATWEGTARASSGTLVRLLSLPLSDNGHVYGALQVGEPLTAIQTTLRSVTLALLVIIPAILILGALGSYWLASRAFQPITHLTRTARDIEARDLHRRVPVPAAHDEVRALALTLNAMIARIERAFEQQRRFVSDASHELRTPVAAIQNLSDVALTQPGERADYEEALRGVNAEAVRLGRLIGDLLALARADEGQSPLDLDTVRLDQVVATVADVVEPLAAERGVRLEVRAPRPVSLVGDEARLIQLTLNLLDNAIRYTLRGGEVLIMADEEDQRARLVVRDTGWGIAPESLPHIFERFYRAEAETGETEGSGLGLSIASWIVHAHGGEISVESQVGQGTTMTVSLPRTPPKSSVFPMADDEE